MKALVTAPNSFVGSTLIEELDTLGFEVCALISKGGSSENLKNLKVQKIEGDLRDFDSLCKAMKEVNYVFHLDEVSTARNRSELFDYNAKGTERLAKAASAVGSNISRFVYLSNLAAAGPASTLKPKVESEKDHPISAYGKSKLQGEKELLKYKTQFPISIIRPSWVYGPKDPSGFLLIQAVARNLMPILNGATKDGHKYYSAIHAQDLCRGLVQAAVVPRKKAASGEVFYLSGDGVYTYQDLMSTIAERLNRDPVRIKVPRVLIKTVAVGLSAFGLITGKTFPLNLERVNDFLSDYWICSNQKAKRVLGFSPEFDLSSGLANSIEWYQKQKWI